MVAVDSFKGDWNRVIPKKQREFKIILVLGQPVTAGEYSVVSAYFTSDVIRTKPEFSFRAALLS